MMVVRRMVTKSLVACSLAAGAGCAAVLGFDSFLPGVEERDADVNLGIHWFVSPFGNDGNDGSRQHPLRTIAKALERATIVASGAARPSPEASSSDGSAASDTLSLPQRIGVCSGDYLEARLEVAGPIEILGNFDCETWLRPQVDSQVVGVGLESRSKLTLNNPDDKVFIQTLANDRGAPVLEGLTVRAQSVESVIEVNGAATLRALTIINTTLPGRSASTSGISAINGKGVVVEQCSVALNQDGLGGGGGSEASDAGEGTPWQGIGIAMLAVSGARIFRSSIKLTQKIGDCVGVIGKDSAFELVENEIVMRECVPGPQDRTTSAIGVGGAGSSLTTQRNKIEFVVIGNSTRTTTQVIGLSATPSETKASTFASDGDVVIAPSAPHPTAPASALRFLGVYDDGALTRLVNASIFINAVRYQVEDSSAIGFQSRTNAYVAHNSIFVSAINSDAGVPLRGILLHYDRNVGDGTMPSALQLTSNLFVTADPRLAFVRARCATPASGIAAATNNRYAGSAEPLSCAGGGASGNFAIWPEVDASNNQRFDCPDAGCLAVFRTGPGEIERDGLRLAEEGCGGQRAIFEVPYSAAVPVDGANAARQPKTTVGAFEQSCR